MNNPTGNNRLPTALELFKEYRPKFQEVELVPLNLETKLTNSSRFYFELIRNGVYIQQLGKFKPTLFLGIAKLDFKFVFDSGGQFGIIPQLTRCIADEIRTRFLAGRKFLILPHPLHPIESLSSDHPYVVRVEGDPIPGFYSGEDGEFECSWVDFIPTNTPEWKQIRAALEYEAAMREAVDGAIAIGKEIEMKDWFQKLLPPK